MTTTDESTGTMSAPELKRTSARELGNEFANMIDRIRKEGEYLDFDDWYKLVMIFMQRPETMEVFMEVLRYCEAAKDVLHPSKSKVFKDYFLRYAATDMNDAFINRFGDVIAWMEFKIGASGLKRVRKGRSLLEAF